MWIWLLCILLCSLRAAADHPALSSYHCSLTCTSTTVCYPAVSSVPPATPAINADDLQTRYDQVKNWHLQRLAHSADQYERLAGEVLLGQWAGQQQQKQHCLDPGDNLFRSICDRLVDWPAQNIAESCAIEIRIAACTLADWVECSWYNRSDVQAQLPEHTEFRETVAWPVDALDMTAKADQLLVLVYIWGFGKYDECANIDWQDRLYDNTSTTNILMKYCTFGFNIKQLGIGAPFQILQGTCWPRTCSTDDVTTLLYNEMRPYLNKTIDYAAQPFINCDQGHPEALYDYFMIGVTLFCAFVAVLIIVGTIWDLAKQKQNAKLPKGERPGLAFRVLVCFSLYSNGGKLISTEHRSGNVDCIQGIRLFSMAWVVLGHTYFFATPYAQHGYSLHIRLSNEFMAQMINNATVSVDTFFCLSGFLVCYLFLRQMQKPDNRNNLSNPLFWLMYYVHRYLRLTPVLGVATAVMYAYWPYSGSGPFWGIIPNNALDNCRYNWWTNLVYINNFYDSSKECIGWVWYLANDMQFYWLSPIFLLGLCYVPWVGLCLLAAQLAASMLYTLIITYTHNYPPSSIVTAHPEVVPYDSGEYFDRIYQFPVSRIGVYMVGMTMAYGLHVYERKYKDKKWNKWLVVLVWMFAIGLQWAVIWGPYHYAAYGELRSGRTGRAFYAMLNRVTWGVSVGLVICLCHTGHGGPINALLSWSALWPFSRLTYCVYLLHPAVIMYTYGSLRKPFIFSHYDMVYYYLANLGVTFVLGLCLSLMFEAPCMQLEKLIFQFRDPSNKPNEKPTAAAAAAAVHPLPTDKANGQL